MAGPNDLAASYLGSRQQAAMEEADATIRSLLGTTELLPMPPASGNVIDIVPRGTGDGGLGSGSGGGVGAGQGQGAPDRAGALGAVVDAIGTVGRNVGDATMQVLNAPLAAVAELFRAADDIGNWLAGTAPVTDEAATLGGNLGRVIARNVPQIASPPDTPAGRVVGDIAQFLAGFVGAGRVVRGVAGAARSTAGSVGQAMTAGAAADFFAMPATRDRLATLWREAGLPDTALTSYLASDPGDEAAEQRLKNMIEGAALGAGVDALLATARGVRAAMRLQGGGQAAAQAQQQALEQRQAAAMVGQAMGALGDAAGPLVSRDVMTLGGGAPAPVAAAAGDPGARLAASAAATSDAALGVDAYTAARGLAGAAEDARGMGPAVQLAPVENTSAIRAAADAGPVYINFARINAPEDVQAVIRDTADAFRGDINAAGREVQTNAETRRLAADLGLSVDDLLSRQRGQPWNAETALAARQILTASGERLAALAQAAAAPNATPADAWAFRRMMAVHHAIQSEVLAARRETARALQSWAMPAGSAREQMRAIEQMLEQSGGVVTAQAMAGRLNALVRQGASPAAIGTLAKAGATASRIGGAFQEAWINGLLSSPTTHVANVIGNAMVMGQQVVERRIAEEFGSSIARGEAMEMMQAVVGGLGDALRLAARSYRDGSGEVGAMLGKVDVQHERAISAQAFGMDQGSGLGKAIDFFGHSIVNAPSRALGAEDAFFKSILYRMQLRAGARRMARDEILTVGTLAPDSPAFTREMLRRRDELLADPPEALRLEAADLALYATFNRPATEGVQALLRLRDSTLGQFMLLPYVMPFIRTPANILSYGFERTPLAPLVGQWRADVAAGGARRDLALARLASGAAVLAVAFDFADRGLITGDGPDDPGEREVWQRNGIPAYAIRVGDQWVTYNRLDPLAMPMAFAATMAEALRRRQIEPEEVDEVGEILALGIAATAGFIVDRSYFSGLASLLSAITDPERGAEGFVNRQAGSLVPAIVAQAERAYDPAGSLAMTMTEAMQARIPRLASQLPPRRNLWGEVVTNAGVLPAESQGRAIFDAVTPASVVESQGRPIDQELLRMNLSIQRLGKRQEFDGAPVNLSAFPEVYDRLVRLAGNELQIQGKGLADALDEMVQGQGPLGPTYAKQSDGREGGKAAMIRFLVQQYREAARAEIERLPEFGAFSEMLRERRMQQIEQRLPPGAAMPTLR